MPLSFGFLLGRVMILLIDTREGIEQYSQEQVKQHIVANEDAREEVYNRDALVHSATHCVEQNLIPILHR